jgi:hypothetical protein
MWIVPLCVHLLAELDIYKRFKSRTCLQCVRTTHWISKLDRKTNEYIRGKMDAQDMILDDITPETTYLVWPC